MLRLLLTDPPSPRTRVRSAAIVLGQSITQGEAQVLDSEPTTEQGLPDHCSPSKSLIVDNVSVLSPEFWFTRMTDSALGS